jgi:hypothetical protein
VVENPFFVVVQVKMILKKIDLKKLPTPGEAKAKAMPRRLYIRTK